MTDIDGITKTFDVRVRELEAFVAFLSCDARHALDTLVLAIKGRPSAGESAGGIPLSGRDGVALAAAFERLGWGEAKWCGVLLAPCGVSPLTEEPKRLRLLLEILDPLLIVALDEEARLALVNVLNTGGALTGWHKKTATEVQGRLLVSVDGFESALDSEIEKQLVWQQLKQAARTEALKRLA